MFNGTTILLFAVGALGFLPLAIVLMKRNTYRRIIGSGGKTSATIIQIVPGMRNMYGKSILKRPKIVTKNKRLAE